MAYLDTNIPFLAAMQQPCSAPVDAARAHRAVERSFARQEWEVIALARTDGISSLREPSRLTRALNRIFGFDGTRQLANKRLEALRRFAVLAWHHGYQLPASGVKMMLTEGYSSDQIELLLASVAVERIGRRRGERA